MTFPRNTRVWATKDIGTIKAGTEGEITFSSSSTFYPYSVDFAGYGIACMPDDITNVRPQENTDGLTELHRQLQNLIIDLELRSEVAFESHDYGAGKAYLYAAYDLKEVLK